MDRREKEEFLFAENLDEAKAKLTQSDFEELSIERDEVIATFSTPAGQKTFLHLIDATYLFKPFIGQNASNYAKEAKREIGLYYMKLLGVEAFMSLYNEAAKKELETLERIKRGEKK